jgi:redox-sensitive bicupin YhaK (pirin superfamily)
MVQQNKGKIFLAEERGLNQMEWFRSYNTFNFGQYQQEHKIPFGPLYVLNDDTVAGGETISMVVEADSDVLLVPVVGAISYKDSRGNSMIIEAGECQLYATPKGTTIHIGNLYKDELVNFLQIWFYRSAIEEDLGPQLIPFDIVNYKNQAVPIPTDNSSCKYAIGKYAGRSESIYHLQNAGNGLFVFVIQGAFEVQYRLLQARDGLALWEADAVEWEALSNDAIILVMEVPLNTDV